MTLGSSSSGNRGVFTLRFIDVGGCHCLYPLFLEPLDQLLMLPVFVEQLVLVISERRLVGTPELISNHRERLDHGQSALRGSKCCRRILQLLLLLMMLNYVKLIRVEVRGIVVGDHSRVS